MTSNARNWDEYRMHAARRIVASNPSITHLGTVQQPSLAIPVLDIELNSDGSVRNISVMREPSQAKDTTRIAIDAVRRAGSFGDVSRDKTLPGDPREDATVKAAMAVPINPGGGTIGVLYADSVSKPDCFRADDLALFRAMANLAAVAMESDALRRDHRFLSRLDDEDTDFHIT